MRILLDTQAFLWFLLNDPRLSETALDTICDPDNEVNISPASYWEIAIKVSLGKYTLSEPYREFMERQLRENRFRILAIEPKHTAILTELPFYHRDPFDRLIIAQAIQEGIPAVSSDSEFDSYPITRIW